MNNKDLLTLKLKQKPRNAEQLLRNIENYILEKVCPRIGWKGKEIWETI